MHSARQTICRFPFSQMPFRLRMRRGTFLSTFALMIRTFFLVTEQGAALSVLLYSVIVSVKNAFCEV